MPGGSSKSAVSTADRMAAALDTAESATAGGPLGPDTHAARDRTRELDQGRGIQSSFRVTVLGLWGGGPGQLKTLAPWQGNGRIFPDRIGI